MLQYIVFLLFVLAAPLLGQARPGNMDFESGVAGQPPAPWVAGSFPADIGVQAVVVNQGCVQGRLCAQLTLPASVTSTSVGSLGTGVMAAGYQSRRIRFRAAIKTGGAGASGYLYLGASNQDLTRTVLNLQSASTTSTEWQHFQLEGVVPSDAGSIYMGFALSGPGSIWADDASLEVLGRLVEETPEAARALSDTGLANLVAFTRLLGCVRHFHPSDEASLVDWDAFTILGARAVESAATPAELTARLETHFAPIAPTVRIFPTGNPPALPPDLQPPSTAPQRIIRWINQGIYSSQRDTQTVPSGPLPAGFADPARPFEEVLGRGLSAWIPLTLYLDTRGTLPHSGYQGASDFYNWISADRGTRLGAVIKAWNVPRHFYPYWDVLDHRWNSALETALLSAATDGGADDFLLTLRRLVSAQQDGHGYADPAGAPPSRAIPLVWTLIDGQLIVSYMKNSQTLGVAPGDRVLTINGRPVDEVLASQRQLVSGATPQWIEWRTLTEAAMCEKNLQRMTIEVEPFARPGTRLTADFACTLDLSRQEARPDLGF